MNTQKWLIAVVVLLAVVVSAQTWVLWKMHAEGRAGEAAQKDVYRPAVIPKSARAATSSQTPFGRNSLSIPSSGWMPGALNEDPWDPFREMQEMNQVMNRLFRDTYQRGMRTRGADLSSLSYDPDVDIQATDGEYLVRVDLPGIEKDQIDVKIANGQLILSGRRESGAERTDEGGYQYMERSFGSFYRSVPLPEDASSENVRAESKDGVLTVHIPRDRKSVV